MKILIVEDEQHSREELEYLLTKLEPTTTLETSENALLAWEKLEIAANTTEPFEVVFLDIQMPVMNGLELAARIARLNQPPRIIFATANPDHALTAFDLEGVDYVLKPYRTSRLAQTLERIHKLNANPISSVQLEKIWAGRGEIGTLLDPTEILYCQADGDTIVAHTTNLEKLELRISLQDLETRFRMFTRVHKSFLVNLDYVRHIEPYFSGSYRLLLKDNTSRIPLSRQYAKILRKRLTWL